MRITAKVTPGASVDSIELTEDGTYIVRVTPVAEGGKATRRAVELIAKELKVPKTHISLIKGAKSRHKIFEFKQNS